MKAACLDKQHCFVTFWLTCIPLRWRWLGFEF